MAGRESRLQSDYTTIDIRLDSYSIPARHRKRRFFAHSVGQSDVDNGFGHDWPENRQSFPGVIGTRKRARWAKLANRQAGYATSLPPYSHFVLNGASCSARLTAAAVSRSRSRANQNRQARSDMEETKRKQHLRVPVFEHEKRDIEESARAAGLSVAAYLRQLGLGFEVRGILDYEKVDELAKISADLGRLGGLLKMWLSNDERLQQFSEAQIEKTIKVAMERIEEGQEEMSRVMQAVLMQPR